MILKTLEVSMFATNCYIVACSETKEGVIIDPGAQGKEILQTIKSMGLTIKYIVNTHGHVDHIGANGMIKEALKLPILLNEKDMDIYRNPGYGLGIAASKQPEPDCFIKDGDRISFGKMDFKVIETPGHSRGCVSLLTEGAVFTGDTLFAGSIGRTDLPGGSFESIIKSIEEKLMVLSPETVVYPGHGPYSTIGEEARSNPFINP